MGKKGKALVPSREESVRKQEGKNRGVERVYLVDGYLCGRQGWAVGAVLAYLRQQAPLGLGIVLVRTKNWDRVPDSYLRIVE
jgi:hypothetical protein